MNNEYIYIGTELELFAQAKNWKSYLKKVLNKYIRGKVLEVGAGLGSNSIFLANSSYKSWLCLEPDSNLFAMLESNLKAYGLVNFCCRQGTLDTLSPLELFEAILYIDVLEHIETDQEELIKASQKLNYGGNLMILSPAHQWLYSDFDKSIGHYRRYNKEMLKAILPNDLKLVKLIYLDSVGLLASLANKLFLKQSHPTLKQIQAWDRFMVPLSTKIDSLLNYTIGKSILLIAEKR